MTNARLHVVTSLLALAALLLVACNGSDITSPGGGGGGGGTDRSGTWTITATDTNPCPGDPATETFQVLLTQSGDTLTGTQCADGYRQDWSLALSGTGNTSFSGTVSGCESLNDDCQPPFGTECYTTTVLGTINGNTFSGSYTFQPVQCSPGGTFTGTID